MEQTTEQATEVWLVPYRHPAGLPCCSIPQLPREEASEMAARLPGEPIQSAQAV